jgi:parallel beta-helix repeat protein
MRRSDEDRHQRVMVLAFSLAAAVGLTAASASAQVCPAAITACGCKITSPGLYTISRNLSGAAGQVCIDIQSAHTILQVTRANTINGAGSGTGIWLESTAQYSVVSGVKRAQVPSPLFGFGAIPPLPPIPGGRDEALIQNFTYGIEDDANNTVVEFFHGLNRNTKAGLYLNGVENVTAGNFCADRNQVAGVLAVGVTNSRMFDFTAEQNPGDGVEMQSSNNNAVFNLTAVFNTLNGLELLGSSNNSLAPGTASQNKGEGITLGCTDGGCTSSSDSNHITTFAVEGRYDATGDNCETFAPLRPPVQTVGIHLQEGNQSNIVTGNFTGQNSSEDLQDDNTDCGSNEWTNNVFTKATPGCAGNP